MDPRKFDFSDAEFIDFCLKENTLFIFIENWKEEKFEIRFPFCFYFHYEPGDVLASFNEDSNSELLKKIGKKYFEDPHQEIHLKIFQIRDISDNIVAEVVSESPIIDIVK